MIPPHIDNLPQGTNKPAVAGMTSAKPDYSVRLPTGELCGRGTWKLPVYRIRMVAGWRLWAARTKSRGRSKKTERNCGRFM